MRHGRKVDLGSFRDRVEIHTATRVDDGMGGFTRTDPTPDTLIGTYWADVQPITARERQWGDQFTEVTTHKCWLRYAPSLAQIEGYLLIDQDNTHYYVETVIDPDRKKNVICLTLREGGPT